MEQRTGAHLETAERNRDIAHALADQAAPLGVQPPPVDWALVVALYAAVHFVNAYLWEARRYEPRSHDLRLNAVARAPALRAALESYTNLGDLAYRARYHPRYRPPRSRAAPALRVDLPTVERVVLAALNVAT